MLKIVDIYLYLPSRICHPLPDDSNQNSSSIHSSLRVDDHTHWTSFPFIKTLLQLIKCFLFISFCWWLGKWQIYTKVSFSIYLWSGIVIVLARKTFDMTEGVVNILKDIFKAILESLVHGQWWIWRSKFEDWFWLYFRPILGAKNPQIPKR